MTDGIRDEALPDGDPRPDTGAGIEIRRPAPGVAWVVLNRPGKRNALARDAGRHLAGLFRELADDHTVRSVVISGEHGHFSAGGDVDVIRSLPRMTARQLEERFTSCFRASLTLREMRKPVIGALTGGVVGGAMGLALACDIRLGSFDVFFKAPFVRMGLVPDYGASWLLPQTVGASAALDISISTRAVAAGEALRLGLVSRLVGDPVGEALDLATSISGVPSFGVAETKRLAHLSSTTDFAAGVAAEVVAQTSAFHTPGARASVENYVAGIGARRGR
nr:enoyl-CoA hydratase/isomerase family protein [Pseudonocardia sp. C8]